MKPICVPCQRFYRPKKNGFYFMEGMPCAVASDGDVPLGTERPDLWKPYKLWSGDLWRCQGCGAEIVVGVAHRPISEHYQDGFSEIVQNYAVTLQVNDC